MDNIETYAKTLWAEYEQPGHKPKSKEEILLALVGCSSIVSITVQSSAFGTTTITSEDLLKQYWDCLKLRNCIEEWCKKEASDIKKDNE